MTSRARPEVWLGDLICAVAALRPADATIDDVRTLLGLGQRAAAPPTMATAPRLARARRVPTSAVRGRESEPTGDEASAVRPPFERTQPVPPVVVGTSETPSTPPRALPRVADLLAPPRQPARRPPEDLLAAGRQRALLSALSSGVGQSGELDMDAAVDRIARGERLEALPQVLRLTTRRGLEVLVDLGEAMVPFAADQTAVLQTVGRTCGPDGLRVVRFAVTPLDEPGAGLGPLWTWEPYRAPPAGVPVLALTDLGALAPVVEQAAVQARWIRFAGVLRTAGCPLVALVPVPVRRLPTALLRAVPVTVWDRPTGVRDAVAAVRRASGQVPRRRPR